jgi:hypothetical protein
VCRRRSPPAAYRRPAQRIDQPLGRLAHHHRVHPVGPGPDLPRRPPVPIGSTCENASRARPAPPPSRRPPPQEVRRAPGARSHNEDRRATRRTAYARCRPGDPGLGAGREMCAMRRSRAKSYRKLHRTCCAVKSSPRRRRSMEHSRATGCLVDQLSKAGPSCTTIIAGNSSIARGTRAAVLSPAASSPALAAVSAPRPASPRPLGGGRGDPAERPDLARHLRPHADGQPGRPGRPRRHRDGGPLYGLRRPRTSLSANYDDREQANVDREFRPSSASAWRSSTSSAPASTKASLTWPPPSRSSRPRPSTSRATSWAGARTFPTCSSRRSTCVR